MKPLNHTDLQFVVRRLPKDVRELLMNRPLFLGGGFIRETIAGNTPQDIDLFGAGHDVLRQGQDALMATRRASGEPVRPLATKNAFTIVCPPRLAVQFIHRWVFSKPEDLVASFDFTVCQVAIWFDKTTGDWVSLTADDFYADLAARRLVYTFPVREEEAGGSMMRVMKFIKRGYNIQPDNLGAVIARVADKVNWGRVDGEQDAARIITGLLYEVDPLLVVDGLEPRDPNTEDRT